MPEEVLNQELEEQESAVDIIAEMKANTVSKEKYTRLETEHNKLLRALAKGEDVEVQAPEKPDLDELRLSLYTEEVQKLRDIDVVSKTLKLRQAIIDEGGEDPFVPFGKHTAPTDQDYATAEKVANVLQECVEFADGDNAVFISELQRRTMDVSPLQSKAKRR